MEVLHLGLGLGMLSRGTCSMSHMHRIMGRQLTNMATRVHRCGGQGRRGIKGAP